jgi:hypothetical protein
VGAVIAAAARVFVAGIVGVPVAATSVVRDLGIGDEVVSGDELTGEVWMRELHPGVEHGHDHAAVGRGDIPRLRQVDLVEVPLEAIELVARDRIGGAHVVERGAAHLGTASERLGELPGVGAQSAPSARTRVAPHLRCQWQAERLERRSALGKRLGSE